MYQYFSVAMIKHHNITKSDLKNEELILTYRGGAHNGEEGMETGTQRRKSADHISSCPEAEVAI